MCSGMGRLGRDDPDGGMVSPGVQVGGIFAGESGRKGLSFGIHIGIGVLVTGSSVPSADTSDGSGALSTGDDELGVVDGGGRMQRAAVAAEVTRPNTKVVTFGGSVHSILFMLVKLKTLGMLIRPQVLHFCLTIMKTVAAIILMTQGNGRRSPTAQLEGELVF
jgi:hypothetical protein